MFLERRKVENEDGTITEEPSVWDNYTNSYEGTGYGPYGLMEEENAPEVKERKRQEAENKISGGKDNMINATVDVSKGETVDSGGNVIDTNNDTGIHDISDDWTAWNGANGNKYNSIGEFMFDGSMEDWMDMVQDPTMSYYYQDMFDGDVFNENTFNDWWTDSKSKGIEDYYSPTGGVDETEKLIGGDFDAYDSMLDYAISNKGLTALSDGFNSLDTDSLKKALAYKHIANAATKALADGSTLDFGRMFSLNDINRFLGDDYYEVGSLMSPGFKSAAEAGFDNVDPSIIRADNEYNDGNVYLPIAGALDNILAALGDGYGVRRKTS